MYTYMYIHIKPKKKSVLCVRGEDEEVMREREKKREKIWKGVVWMMGFRGMEGTGFEGEERGGGRRNEKMKDRE